MAPTIILLTAVLLAAAGWKTTGNPAKGLATPFLAIWALALHVTAETWLRKNRGRL